MTAGSSSSAVVTGRSATAAPVACVDVGSTWTKGALVSVDGELLGTASHVTTPPEVLRGLDAVTLDRAATVLACSSAGGGLRLAVVGQEPLVSAEAGRRVALSAGARVVHVSAGDLDAAGVRALRASRPDVVLLVGGTDGGDARTLLHNARRLAAARVRPPIVLAGNAAARDDAATLLAATGRTVVACDNVLPDVGELAPGPAREAIREVFLRHVIGGKGLSRGPRFRRLVRLVTPDAVLVGVERLAGVLGSGEAVGSSGSVRPGSAVRGPALPGSELSGSALSGSALSGSELSGSRPSGSATSGGGVEAGAALVVDVGGATTDVYSAVSDVPDGPAPTVALPPRRRTVEGDLGMRWSAPGVVAEAVIEKLVDPGVLDAAAARRAADPSWLPGADPRDGEAIAEADVDVRLATLAAILAARRHLRAIDGRLGPRGAGLLVLSGGVFRHAPPSAVAEIEAALRADPVLRPVLRHAAVRVDADYVLAPAGLLAHSGRTAAADRLVTRLLG